MNSNSKTLIALALAVGLGLLAPLAWAYSTHPDVTFSRTFDPQPARPGQVVQVSLVLSLGGIGVDSLSGVVLSEHVPQALSPGAASLQIDGAGLVVVEETTGVGAIELDCVTLRWVLAAPPGFPQGNLLPVGSSLRIVYPVTVPGDAPPGTIAFPGATWLGMVPSQGDGGDHFGFEDALALLEVEAAGNDQDQDGLPDDWELANGLDPDDPSDADADPDGDGFSNTQEYLASTDPQDSSSYPQQANQAPSALAQAQPGSGEAPLLVHFSGSGQDPDGDPLTFAWDFGDGESSTLAEPQHSFELPGTYVVHLTVSDDRGASGQATASVLVFEPAVEPPGQEIVGGCGCSIAGRRDRFVWAICSAFIMAFVLRRRRLP